MFFYFLNSWSNFSLHMASEGKGMNWKSVTETVLNLLIHTLESRINILQWIFDLSTFVLRKFFDLRKNFTVPKILVHKFFDLRKISRTTFFDLRKKICGFWSKKAYFWFRNFQISQTLIFFFVAIINNIPNIE